MRNSVRNPGSALEMNGLLGLIARGFRVLPYFIQGLFMDARSQASYVIRELIPPFFDHSIRAPRIERGDGVPGFFVEESRRHVEIREQAYQDPVNGPFDRGYLVALAVVIPIVFAERSVVPV